MSVGVKGKWIVPVRSPFYVTCMHTFELIKAVFHRVACWATYFQGSISSNGYDKQLLGRKISKDVWYVSKRGTLGAQTEASDMDVLSSPLPML